MCQSVCCLWLIGVAHAPPNAASDAIRAEVRGRVVKVADGDTITVLVPATGTTGVSSVDAHFVYNNRSEVVSAAAAVKFLSRNCR